MKKLAAVVGLYIVAWLVASFLWLSFTKSSNALGRRAIELGEQHGAELKGVDGLRDLREACTGKLQPGTDRTIAAYIAKTSVKPKDDNQWDEVLLGITHVWDDSLVRQRPSVFTDPPFTQALKRNANPLDWNRHLTWAKAGHVELEPTRYLIVAKYLTLRPPENQGTDGYTRGAGDYAARVLSFPAGEVLCEGRGEVHMTDTVSASGRAATQEEAHAQAVSNAARLVPFVFSESVTTSPLHALCNVGSDALCKLTKENIGH
jgi:hypothetical protein